MPRQDSPRSLKNGRFVKIKLLRLRGSLKKSAETKDSLKNPRGYRKKTAITTRVPITPPPPPKRYY